MCLTPHSTRMNIGKPIATTAGKFRSNATWRRRFFLLVIAGLLVSLIGRTSSQPSSIFAADGEIVLEVTHAQALVRGNDYFFSERDFYVRASIDGDPLSPAGVRVAANHDDAMWTPALTYTKNVSRQRTEIPLVVELWDKGESPPEWFPDTQMDINPALGSPASPIKTLELFFNTCDFSIVGNGIPVTYQHPFFIGPGSEPEGESASIGFDVRTADGLSFNPDDVVIVRVSPVQVVYDQRYIIAEKATAPMVELASSWSVDKTVDIDVSLGDAHNTVYDSKSVVVSPGPQRIFFFDDSALGSPFYPEKAGNVPLSYTAKINVDGETSEPPSEPYAKCIRTDNNTRTGSIPIINTYSPYTLYQPWDWHSIIQPNLPIFPDTIQVARTFESNERFRKAIFPVAEIRSEISPIPKIHHFPLLIRDYSPVVAIYAENVVAHVAGIDRQVLLTRKNWFRENVERGCWLCNGPNTIGMSQAEYAPHAVIAEQGYSQVVAHELGHTYRLSQHPCSEDVYSFNEACRDEYNHPPGYGPYVGVGFDVLGEIFPTGLGGIPGTREVMATNFMGSTGALDGTYDRWMDSLSFNYLAETMRLPQDPELVSLSGYVRVEDTIENSATGKLFPSFIFEGLPDFQQPPSGLGTGTGTFAVRILTSDGEEYIYRFSPMLTIEDQDTQGYGYFSFAVPWPENGALIELRQYDMSDPTHPTLETLPALDKLSVSPASPEVQGLTVVRERTDIRIAWETSDGDTPFEQLSAILYLLVPNPKPDLPPIPVGHMLTDSEFIISTLTLSRAPGTYGIRLVVSDGVNTTSHEEPEAFRVASPLFLPLLIKQ